MTGSAPTIGLLYAGEMGASLAALLASQGLRVVTTSAARSEQTLTRARAAGAEILEDLAGVVRVASVVLSAVPPAAALEVCEAYASLAHNAPTRAVYVDINSTGPELAASLAKRVTRAGREFVDGAIHGQAMSLTTGAALYLSGTRAGDVAELFANVLRTRVLSSTPGDASTMKMLLGGLSKGMCALFLELGALANRREMVGEFLKESKQFYPGLVSAVDRMLPTYPQHAARRADEIAELEHTAAASGQSPCLIDATHRLIGMLAATDFGSSKSPADWDIQTLAKHLCSNGFLSRSKAPVDPAPLVV